MVLSVFKPDSNLIQIYIIDNFFLLTRHYADYDQEGNYGTGRTDFDANVTMKMRMSAATVVIVSSDSLGFQTSCVID